MHIIVFPNFLGKLQKNCTENRKSSFVAGVGPGAALPLVDKNGVDNATT
jgi:hypothetical protein